MRLPKQWETKKLIIRSSVLEDCGALKGICASWKDKVSMEGMAFTDDYIENCITNGDLPPIDNADPSDFYMMTILDRNGAIIGFFNFYHGYPDQNTLWIGLFVIDAEVQGKAYGKEVLDSISQQGKTNGWKSIGLGVYLKNWKGLRFWYRNGFNTITGIYGDKEYSDKTFSLMGLRKDL